MEFDPATTPPPLPDANPVATSHSKNPIPRVSIGLPVYNGEQFIAKTLDSLLNQTFKDFEVIIADNASTDRTLEIVGTYAKKDPRIHYFCNPHNKGASHNFNAVLELASGEYFRWMAADDIIHPECLSHCVQALDHDPNLILVYPKAVFIDENDLVLYHFDDVVQLEPWSNKIVKQTSQMLNAVFRDGRAANVVIFGLAKTKVLRSIQPLGNYFGCDLVFVTELALTGRIVEIPKVLAFYRRHGKSSSGYTRVPSATSQQQFFDPSIRNRFYSEFQLRRRYIEIFHAISRAHLKLWERLVLSTQIVAYIFRRIAWRLAFEIKVASGQPVNQLVIKHTRCIGSHWSEF